MVITLTIKANDQVNGARMTLSFSDRGVEAISMRKGIAPVPLDDRAAQEAKAEIESLLKRSK